MSIIYRAIQVNTKHLYNICTMLDQRGLRWADVVQMFCVYWDNYVTLYDNKSNLKELAQAKIIKKSVILFWLLNMTI